MTGRPDPANVEPLVEKIGHIVRAHVRAARNAAPANEKPGAVVEAAREALNAMAAVAALTVAGAPTSANLFDFFQDAFRSQIAACIEHKINPPARN